jgi:cytochrome c553
MLVCQLSCTKHSRSVAAPANNSFEELMKKTPLRAAALLASLTVAALCTLPALAQEPAKVDSAAMVAKGQQIASTVCAACHAADGNSMQAINPSLAGQPAGYIAKQLEHFKSGVRDNAIMKGFASALSSEDMKAVGEYFSRQKPRVIGAKDMAVAKAGETIWRSGIASKGVPACTACHGPAGAGVPAQYPRLGGQHPDYTIAQLKAFAGGTRGAHDKDAGGKVMMAFAGKLSEGEMKALAEYASGLR